VAEMQQAGRRRRKTGDEGRHVVVIPATGAAQKLSTHGHHYLSRREEVGGPGMRDRARGSKLAFA
jgi:hypothetical protein